MCVVWPAATGKRSRTKKRTPPPRDESSSSSDEDEEESHSPSRNDFYERSPHFPSSSFGPPDVQQFLPDVLDSLMDEENRSPRKNSGKRRREDNEVASLPAVRSRKEVSEMNLYEPEDDEEEQEESTRSSESSQEEGDGEQLADSPNEDDEEESLKFSPDERREVDGWSIKEVHEAVKDDLRRYGQDSHILRIMQFMSAFSDELSHLGEKALLQQVGWTKWKEALKRTKLSKAKEEDCLWDSASRRVAPPHASLLSPQQSTLTSHLTSPSACACVCLCCCDSVCQNVEESCSLRPRFGQPAFPLGRCVLR